jgi:hypothetical protein
VPRLVCLSVTSTAFLILSITSPAQTFAPPNLKLDNSEQAAKKDPIQVITRELPEVITKETSAQGITKEKAPMVTKQPPEVIAKAAPQVVTREKKSETAKAITSEPIRPIAASKPTPQGLSKRNVSERLKPIVTEPIRPIAHYDFKTPEGKQESVPVITNYYPNQIVHPLARADRHLDPKLTRAATIAQERAHAHSRSMCWHYVKEALLASGVIDSRPKSEYARDAAQDLVSNYGFKRLSVQDPFAAPIGSVLVYGTSRSVGHVEIRTKDGFVSDFRSPTPSHRPLIGIYAKL